MKSVILGSFLFIFALSGFSQETSNNNLSTPAEYNVDLEKIINDNRRDEIQRYTGYEALLARYLTLPYDICMNTANQGRYFDIGFPLFALAPLILILAFYKKRKIFYSLILLCSIYYGLCKYYSFNNIDGIGVVQRNSVNWNGLTGSSDLSFSNKLVVYFDFIFTGISYIIFNLIESISGNEDHITYGVIISFLLAGLSLLYLRFSGSKIVTYKILVSTCFVFIIVWQLLSGGIAWYGFLAIPILFILSFLVEKKSGNSIFKLLVLVFLGLWVVLGYSASISNIILQQPKDSWGKNILNNYLIPYSTGLFSSNESRDLMYNNISSALEKINSSNGGIYQVGTSLSYDIKDDLTRVVEDNTLDKYYWIVKSFKNLSALPAILKESDIEFIIVDLYTPTLDKTPEKSLTQKYKLLLVDLYKSEDVKLLATDRIINLTFEGGQVTQLNHIFAKGYSDQAKIEIANFGSYAIFQIM